MSGRGQERPGDAPDQPDDRAEWLPVALERTVSWTLQANQRRPIRPTREISLTSPETSVSRGFSYPCGSPPLNSHPRKTERRRSRLAPEPARGSDRKGRRTNSDAMEAAIPCGVMPANVSDSERAIVTGGLPYEVGPVNQYAEVMYCRESVGNVGRRARGYAEDRRQKSGGRHRPQPLPTPVRRVSEAA
jgi:hypothetical protein